MRDVENPSFQLKWKATLKNPSSVSGRVCKWMRGSIRTPQHTELRLLGLSAADVCCLEAFRSLEQVELNRFALVQCAIAIFLDGGEMNENVFTRGPLDEAVSFGPVKPLYCTLLSHKVTPFSPSLRFAQAVREACASDSP